MSKLEKIFLTQEMKNAENECVKARKKLNKMDSIIDVQLYLSYIATLKFWESEVERLRKTLMVA